MVHPSVCPPFLLPCMSRHLWSFTVLRQYMIGWYMKSFMQKNTAQDLVLSGVDSLSVRAKLLSYSCVSSNRINS